MAIAMMLHQTLQVAAHRRQRRSGERLAGRTALLAGAAGLALALGWAGSDGVARAASPAAAPANKATAPAITPASQVPNPPNPIKSVSAKGKRFDLMARLRGTARAPTEGARVRMAGLPVRPVNFNEIVTATVQRNLDILQATENVGVAQAVAVQTDAVFDPVIFTSLSYTNQYAVKREEVIGRFRDVDSVAEQEAERERLKQEAAASGDFSNTNPTQNLVCRIDSDDFPAGSVQTLSSLCFAPARYSNQLETAVPDTLSQHVATGALGGSLQFPFGGTTSLNISSTWRKKGFFSTSGDPALTSAVFRSGLTYDPYGWNTKLFWTSSANLAFSTPLPYTKGFGTEGNPSSFNRSISEIDVKRQGARELSQRNQRLSETLQAYWDLVRTVKDLQIITELHDVLAERLDGQKRLLESGLTTRYDVGQIEIQLTSLDASEEASWNQYLTTSNRLLTLVAADQRALLVPADPDAALTTGVPRADAPATTPVATGPASSPPQYASTAPAEIETAAAVSPTAAPASNADFERAIANHPDIRFQEQTYEISKATLAFRDSQNLPDLSFTASASVGQTDSAFGYENVAKSLFHIFQPDNANFFVGLRYRYPLWNNATEAALSRARIEERQAFDALRDTRQRIVSDVDRATGDLRSAESVVHQRDQDIKLAEFAFDRAREQRELGLVSEFEVLNRYSAVLSARLGRSTALANYQKANVRLLAAQGILEQHYVR